MIFKDIVTQFKGQDKIVLDHLIYLYPDQKKAKEGYAHVITELQKLKPKKNKMTIVIDHVKDEDGDYWHVGGEYKDNPRNKNSYAIEFTNWERWLGMTVDSVSLKQMSMLDFYCYCLWEMTFDGFDQDQIQGHMDEINRRVEEVKSGEAKTIPWEEVKENLEKKINKKA